MTVTHFLLLLVLDIIILFQHTNKNKKIDLILIESFIEDFGSNDVHNKIPAGLTRDVECIMMMIMVAFLHDEHKTSLLCCLVYDYAMRSL
jgi:hypothetical protein